jgi:hypothetical protein
MVVMTVMAVALHLYKSYRQTPRAVKSKLNPASRKKAGWLMKPVVKGGLCESTASKPVLNLLKNALNRR